MVIKKKKVKAHSESKIHNFFLDRWIEGWGEVDNLGMYVLKEFDLVLDFIRSQRSDFVSTL